LKYRIEERAVDCSSRTIKSGFGVWVTFDHIQSADAWIADFLYAEDAEKFVSQKIKESK
jgi:hypothetical protein